MISQTQQLYPENHGNTLRQYNPAKRILIADDNEELLGLLTDIFKKDYSVLCCTDPGEIYAAIGKFLPHLLLLDNRIGNTSSEYLVNNFREKENEFVTPFLLVSADPAVKEIAHKLGAHGFIEKPFDVAYIRSYIKNVFLEIDKTLF